MPTFAYSGRTRQGQTVAGERVAETIDAAIAGLRREQIQVTRIDPAKAEKAAAKAKPKKGAKAPSKNLAIFTRQFSVMIDAGLPLVQCLDILGKQEPHKGFSDVILQVRSDVESGAALADAMKKHPRAFDPLYSKRLITLEAAMNASSLKDELEQMIERGTGVVAGAGMHRAGAGLPNRPPVNR